MIDWWFVAVRALWIFGLSIALAVFSYRDWLMLSAIGALIYNALSDQAAQVDSRQA